jgi:hypothetical protein
MILLPDDVEFHEDIRLLIYRPRGVLNEQSVDTIVSIIGDLEAKLQEPFNRFFDTLGHDEVELNFRYVVHISLYRVLSYGDRPPVKSAILATDSTIAHYCQLHAIITKDSPDQRSNISRTGRSREMARRADRAIGPEIRGRLNMTRRKFLALAGALCDDSGDR